MPIRFAIYREGKQLTSFTPVAAMAIGPESVPVAGEATFSDGLLSVRCSDEQPAGLGLLWNAGEVGEYHLETTRLPPREEPYILNVELARFRLMKIMQKQEDWNLFDFPRAEKYLDQFKQIQAVFAQALAKLDTPAEAARLGDAALADAIVLSEDLANFHGELLLNRRRQANAFAKHIFGCRADSTVLNQRYKDTLAERFDYAVLPMSWRQIQPEEGEFVTASVDEWMELLGRKRIPIIAGPLIDLSEANVPDWMFIWENDFDTLRELAYEHVNKVVQRFRKSVAVWNVVAGLHAGSAFSLSFEQTIELTRLLVSQVKSILPGARTLVTVTQPFGEYHSRGGVGVPPMLYAEMVTQAGVNFEAFGLELEMGVPTAGSYTRDMFQISCMLDRFASINRPVFLTSVGVPDRMTADPSDRSEGRLEPSKAGRWHVPWDPAQQGKWLENVYKLALSKPFVESIAWGNLSDLGTTIPGGGLLDDMLRPKPAYLKLQEMHEQYQRRRP
jgi:glycosyl hydrolase family 10